MEGKKFANCGKKLIKICENYQNCSTTSLKRKSSKSDRKQGILAIFETKKQSVFCLEPEGDWPTRQSMIQDIILGCIPVFFTRSHLRLWSAFWGNFIDSVSIVLNYDGVMDGKVDVMKKLEDIPPHEIWKKQRIMKKHKHQFDFLHVNDYMTEGNNYRHSCSVDATNLLLHELKLSSGQSSA